MGGGILTQLVLDAHVSVNGSKNSYCIIMSLLHQLTFDKQLIISLRKGPPYKYIFKQTNTGYSKDSLEICTGFFDKQDDFCSMCTISLIGMR